MSMQDQVAQPGCGYTLPLSQVKGKYHIEFKNNEKPFLMAYLLPPLQMAEAGKLKDALSEMLHGAVTQPFKTKSFWICSEVYLPVVRAGESHLLWQGAPPSQVYWLLLLMCSWK